MDPTETQEYLAESENFNLVESYLEHLLTINQISEDEIAFAREFSSQNPNAEIWFSYVQIGNSTIEEQKQHYSLRFYDPTQQSLIEDNNYIPINEPDSILLLNNPEIPVVNINGQYYIQLETAYFDKESGLVAREPQGKLLYELRINGSQSYDGFAEFTLENPETLVAQNYADLSFVYRFGFALIIVSAAAAAFYWGSGKRLQRKIERYKLKKRAKQILAAEKRRKQIRAANSQNGSDLSNQEPPSVVKTWNQTSADINDVSENIPIVRALAPNGYKNPAKRKNGVSPRSSIVTPDLPDLPGTNQWLSNFIRDPESIGLTVSETALGIPIETMRSLPKDYSSTKALVEAIENHLFSLPWIVTDIRTSVSPKHQSIIAQHIAAEIIKFINRERPPTKYKGIPNEAAEYGDLLKKRARELGGEAHFNMLNRAHATRGLYRLGICPVEVNGIAYLQVALVGKAT